MTTTNENIPSTPTPSTSEVVGNVVAVEGTDDGDIDASASILLIVMPLPLLSLPLQTSPCEMFSLSLTTGQDFRDFFEVSSFQPLGLMGCLARELKSKSKRLGHRCARVVRRTQKLGE